MTYTREQIEKLALRLSDDCGMEGASAVIRQLLAENDALREDAERYRWLLRNYCSFSLCDEAWKHGSMEA